MLSKLEKFQCESIKWTLLNIVWKKREGQTITRTKTAYLPKKVPRFLTLNSLKCQRTSGLHVGLFSVRGSILHGHLRVQFFIVKLHSYTTWEKEDKTTMSFSKIPALYITAENLFSVVRLHLSLKK